MNMNMNMNMSMSMNMNIEVNNNMNMNRSERKMLNIGYEMGLPLGYFNIGGDLNANIASTVMYTIKELLQYRIKTPNADVRYC